MQEFRVKIGKMTCVNCSNAIERACKKIQGVSEASVSYLNCTGVFLLKESSLEIKIKEKIKALGFEVLQEQSLYEFKLEELKNMKIKLIISMILSLIIMYFEMFIKGNISASIQMLLSLLVIFYCARDFFIHAFKALEHKNLNMNTLISLGVFSSFMYSFFVYLEVFKDEYLYFSSAAMIVSFVLLGKYLEERAKLKSLKYENTLRSMEIKRANVLLDDGSIRSIPSAFVKKDDVILVKEGESVVADGVILSGQAEVDVSFLTGEFLPLFKKKDDEILAGSVLINGSLTIKASKKAIESSLEQIKDLVFKAGNIKTPLANLTNKISAYFVGCIIIFSLFVFVFWYVKAGINLAFLYTCATLLISCPCALGLATPIAIVSALANGARNFILVKNPAVLENLANIKTAIFDKTGTLSKDDLSIYEHNLSKEDFEKLAQIENLSSHPIAKAFAKKRNTSIKLKGRLRVLIGKGLIYEEDDDLYIVGNERLMLENNINIQKSKEFLQEFKDEAPVLLFFAKNGSCLGGVCLKNELKSEAKSVITHLRQRGIKSIILSGDNENSVVKTARELGIDEYYFELNPSEKLHFIEKKKEGVLFIGDGINDAPALNLASVSISFSNANELAKKSGDLILIKNDLCLVIYCFDLSKRTKNIIKLNLFWAFIYNTLCIPIAAGFVPFISLSPHLAALAMCFSSIAVVFNSLRLR